MSDIDQSSNSTIRNILTIFLVVVIFLILSELSSILLPLVLALLFALLFQPLITVLKKKGVPVWINLPLVSILSLIIIFLIGIIVFNATESIINQQDYLIDKLTQKTKAILKWVNGLAGLPIDSTSIVDEIENSLDREWISNAVSGVASGVGSFLGSFLMFALYYVILLAGMTNYKAYLIYVGKKKADFYLKEYENIRRSVFQYMWVKTIISIITGLLTFLICWIFGIKFALFWGFVAFIFNYIPSIGSTIGATLPILMTIIQFDSLGLIIGVALLLISVQLSMGNIIEPIMMGSALRLNTLTVIFGLVFWGYIWGIPGMILSVPLLVIIKIILERIPGFDYVGRMMGYPDKNEIAAH